MSDQRTETAKKVLAGEKSMATLSNLYMLNRQRDDEKHNVRHYITRAASMTMTLPIVEEIESYKPAYRIAELRHLLGTNELFQFLADPLPSWLKYFCMTKEEYLQTVAADTAIHTRNRGIFDGEQFRSQLDQFEMTPTESEIDCTSG